MDSGIAALAKASAKSLFFWKYFNPSVVLTESLPGFARKIA
jgi:hypothetical protein